MVKRRILITGANSGMGKALSLRLAGDGHEIIMLCRNRERGQAAFEEIKKESKSEQLKLVICDLASFGSIRSAAEMIKQDYSSLDVLVNNAGVIQPARYETADGLELQFGVNHLGHFLLTLLLMPLLQKGAGARIVIVSSGAHKIGKMYFDDINLDKKFSTIRAYSRSKLANLLFASELSKRVESLGITVNSLHPGAVGTSMGVNRETGFGKTVMKFLKPFFKTPDQGADTAYYLCLSSEVEKISGSYFINRKIGKPGKRAGNGELSRRLWDLSEQMAGIVWSDAVNSP